MHLLPEGAWPHDGRDARLATACHLQVAVDADSGRVVVVSAHRQPGKGAAGQAVQSANLVLGLPETAGLPSNGSRTVSVTARAAGLPGRRRRRRAQGQRRRRRRPGRQRRPGRTRPPAVFTANRVKAAPVLWSQQVLRDGRVDAVVLNSGGANACTGPDGFQDTHATAEQVADGARLSAPATSRSARPA